MRALVVEDEGFARDYLVSLLRNEYSFDEVYEAPDGEAAWKLLQTHEFQFIVLDLLMPKLDGIKLAARAMEQNCGHRILALSSECDDYTVREVSRCGILGFVSKKEISGEVMDDALREVLGGHVYYSESVKAVVARLQTDPEAYYKILSDRELQVLRAVAQSHTNAEIAAKIGLSPFTVRRHRHNAMKKLGLKTESALLHFALDKGIVKHKSGLDWSD